LRRPRASRPSPGSDPLAVETLLARELDPPPAPPDAAHCIASLMRRPSSSPSSSSALAHSSSGAAASPRRGGASRLLLPALPGRDGGRLPALVRDGLSDKLAKPRRALVAPADDVVAAEAADETDVPDPRRSGTAERGAPVLSSGDDMGDVDEGVEACRGDEEKCIEGDDEIEMVGAGAASCSAGGSAEVDEGDWPTERLRRLRDPIERERVLRVLVGESGRAAASLATAYEVGEVDVVEPDSHRASLFGCGCDGDKRGPFGEGCSSRARGLGTPPGESYEPTRRISSSEAPSSGARCIGLGEVETAAESPRRDGVAARLSKRELERVRGAGETAEEDEDGSGCGEEEGEGGAAGDPVRDDMAAGARSQSVVVGRRLRSLVDGVAASGATRCQRRREEGRGPGRWSLE